MYPCTAGQERAHTRLYCAFTHSRLTPSFERCSQGLADKTPIIDKKAKAPWIMLMQKLFQNID